MAIFNNVGIHFVRLEHKLDGKASENVVIYN